MNDSLELQIGRVLHIGVIVSTICLAAGLVLNLLHLPGADMILRVGVLVLIAAPPSRVILSLIANVRERDWMFTALTAIVLAELGVGVVAALLFHRQI